METIIKRLEQLEGQTNGLIVADLIQEHKTDLDKRHRLYIRKNGKGLPILERKLATPSKANNKLTHDFRGEIVDNIIGYMYGKPIKYEVQEDDDNFTLNKWLDDWEVKNGLPLLDARTGEMASITGYGARLCYINQEGEEAVADIDPWECVFIENQTTKQIDYALRFYEVSEIIGGEARIVTRAEWYDNKDVYFMLDLGDGFIPDYNEPINPKPHMFDYVPLIRFKNNEEMMGDFEKVESLINAYDYLVSDAQNEIEEMVHAYLKIRGIDADENTIIKAKQAGAFVLPEGDIDFITKNINDNYHENQKKTHEENIYKFSKTVNMSDEKFSGGEQSGESRKWKLLSMENNAIKKERYFTDGLMQMFKVLCSSWQRRGIKIDWQDIKITFTRNLPVDMAYYADIVPKLKGTVSDETLFANIPFIDDPQKEIERLEEQNDIYKWNLSDEQD